MEVGRQGHAFEGLWSQVLSWLCRKINRFFPFSDHHSVFPSPSAQNQGVKDCGLNLLTPGAEIRPPFKFLGFLFVCFV